MGPATPVAPPRQASWAKPVVLVARPRVTLRPIVEVRGRTIPVATRLRKLHRAVQPHDSPGGSAQRSRMRGVPRDAGRVVVPPASMCDLRACGLLRLVTFAARSWSRGRDRTSDRAEVRTR